MAGCASWRPTGRPPVAPADSATLAAIAGERALASASSRTVAVPPFRNTADSTLTPLGYALADFLATDLSRSAQLRLVERARLAELLREIDLSRSGRVDSSTAPKAGKLLAAQQLLLGALDTLGGGELRLSVRVADVGTGVVAQALDARAPLRDVLAAEKQVAFRVFEALGVTLTPAERAAVEQRHEASLEALASYGRGVQYELQGDYARASESFTRAWRTDPGFGVARARGQEARARATTSSAVLIPGIRGLESPVSGVIDRLNRPLDLVTIQSRPLPGPGDPAFPTTLVTVVIIIKRP